MPLKILFLDDEEMMGEIFSEYFEDPEFTIQVFTDPSLAIQESLKTKFDLIFLDYRLPSTTGDLVAVKMPSEVPKYLITGELDLESAYPFAGILPKPYNLKLMSEIMQKLLD